MTDYLDETYEVHFEVILDGDATYFPLEKSLAGKLRAAARKRGISTETLVNLWLQERAAQDLTA